jgi:hypothetical protein
MSPQRSAGATPFPHGPRCSVLEADAPEERAALQQVLQVMGGEPPALLERLRRGLAEVESDPTHPWHRELQPLP